ncbi:MAG: sigma 54-interacting transcriptional regulator [Planctomycetes bacterium]|nr:sigma 54-interacting transcriptional regulator [Planctomycetota bacterium]
MTSAWIKLFLEGPWGRRVVRGRDPDRELTIGRGKAATVRIADDTASRVHCRIRRIEGALEIEDLRSVNGTLLNGRVIARDRLVAGDVVQIGATRIRVEVAGHKPPRGPAAAARTADDAAEPDTGREVRGLERTAERLSRQVDNLKSLLGLNRTLLTELDRDKLWECIIDTAIALTRAERGFLILVRDGVLVFEVARNFRREEVTDPEYEVSRSIARDVARQGRSLLTANAEEDERFRTAGSVAKLKLRSVLCVPLRSGDTSIGALYLDNRFEKGLFSEDEVFLLEAFSSQAALALRNADLFAALKESRDQVAELNRQLRGRVETQEAELEKVRRVLATHQESLTFRYCYASIVGRSPAMAGLLKTLDRITPTNLPVLIVGESGTGKELIARAIHFNSPRAGRPFVSENCAAIPATLFESELFGHVPGAFTGADREREGLIELADGGTLFLDEIGDLDPGLQKKLLRVLQEGEIRRLGDQRVRKVDVRIVSATNRNLERLIRERRFREDLYYRLCAVTVQVPPLRERTEDIPALVDHFLARLAATEGGGAARQVDAGALRTLMAHDWPGNVRELENELRRAWHLAETMITRDVLSRAVLEGRERFPEDGEGLPRLRELVDRIERRLIQQALQLHGGNKSRAAEALGLSRVGLRKKMARLGLREAGKARTGENRPET